VEEVILEQLVDDSLWFIDFDFEVEQFIVFLGSDVSCPSDCDPPKALPIGLAGINIR
jgi:hypothetical protein